MATDKDFGRTAFDLLSELLRSWKLFLVVLAIAATVIGIVHLTAKPGTEVSLFWGLAKYQKADTPIPTPLPQVIHKELSNYILPKEENLRGYVSYSQQGFKIFPILDGAVNFYCDDHQVILGGAEISKISVAGKSDRGDKIKAHVDPKTGNVVIDLNSSVAIIELEYKGNLFEIKIYTTDEIAGRFWVTRIAQGSLTLSEYKAL
jgi:hypothetical protein